ncbi:hypothetical protein PIB30_077695, partial [Stylosanthes scabra]|nr:hypothetical protein [Stylosanthes scabra]
MGTESLLARNTRVNRANTRSGKNPNTPKPNLSPKAPAVLRHPCRPRRRQNPSPLPPLQPQVIVATSFAAPEVAFVASHSLSRLTSSRSQAWATLSRSYDTKKPWASVIERM